MAIDDLYTNQVLIIIFVIWSIGSLIEGWVDNRRIEKRNKWRGENNNV